MICSNCNLETGTKAGRHKNADRCVQALIDEAVALKSALQRKTTPKTNRVNPLKRGGRAGGGVELGAPKPVKKAVDYAHIPAGQAEALCGPTHVLELTEKLEADPVIDGAAHPAEAYMAELINHHGSEAIMWFFDVFIMQSYVRPVVVANLMALICRLVGLPGSAAEEKSISWAVGLAALGVYHPDQRISAVCIEALEAWATDECIAMLEEFLEQSAGLEPLPGIGFITRIERVITNIRTRQKTRRRRADQRRN